MRRETRKEIVEFLTFDFSKLNFVEYSTTKR